MPIQIGKHRGSYEILAAIGAGGMGDVYRARDAKLGRERFRRSAAALARHLVPSAFGFCEARGVVSW